MCSSDLEARALQPLPQKPSFLAERELVSRVKPLGRFATTKLAGEGPQVVAGDNLGTATRKLSHLAARSQISTGVA